MITSNLPVDGYYLQYFCRSPSQQIGTDLQTYNQGRSTLNAVADRGAPVPEGDRRELELRQEGLLDHDIAVFLRRFARCERAEASIVIIL